MNEIELIKRAQKGEPFAMEALLNNYKKLVNSVAKNYFLNGGEKDDLISEGMIGLFKAINSYDETKGVNFAVYAKLIIERQIITAIKKANSFKNLPLNESLALNNQGEAETNYNNKTGFVALSENPSPENIVLINELKKQSLNNVLLKLSKTEQGILKLYLNGYNYIDIAKKLGVSPKSVDNGLTRIKNKLKN